jgi:hypothetical protein
VLGIAAVVVAVLPILASTTGAQSFVLTTIGAGAIASGIAAVRSAAWPRRRLKRILGWIGITTGVGGTLLMVMQMLLVYLAAGPTNPVMPLVTNPQLQEAVAPAGESAQPSAQGTTSAPVMSLEMEMVQTLGTLAFTLQASQATDGRWPTTLGTTSSGDVFVAAPQPEARTLVTLPAGTELAYRISEDQLSYGMRLSALTEPGLAVAYDSISGVVTTQ